MQKHASEIAKLRNGYQREIDATIKSQQNRINELDRKANPHRYRLSSGAELIGHRFLGNNPYSITLKIRTKVGDIEHSAVKYLSDNDPALKAFGCGELTEHEFINSLFEPTEQINEDQSRLLDAAIELVAGGTAQAHIGTGGGGSASDMPWEEKDKYQSRKRR